MKQPRNVSSLIELRNVRKIPPLPVLISFVGPVGFDNLTLTADADGAYEWRAIADLEVEVFVSQSIPMPQILAQLADISGAVPRRMILTFVEGPRVECGERRMVCDEQGDFWLFDWFPIAIGPVAYAAGAVIAKRLWSALSVGELPILFERAIELVYQIAAEKQKCA